MPEVTVDGSAVHYEQAGSGETVVFVGDVGFGPWQWGWQVGSLTGPFETVVWDHRGVGQSGGPAAETVEEMVADLEVVLGAVEARRAHVVAAGLGGMVALEYAREYGRVASLILCNTAPSGAAVNRDLLADLHPGKEEPAAIRASLDIGFTDEFLAAEPAMVSQICEWRQAEDGDASTVRAHLEALSEFDAEPLYEIDCPALVCHGIENQVVPMASGKRLADGLPRGSFVPVEGRYLCFVEYARAVNDRMLDFLDNQRRDG